ncbi:hypothetical protein CANCADRAFT_928 [Tortispora caseinolytica NRRL Y-17796]|uniref:arsenate reductase (glutathione/glutaredoxin) n=1 Tax=Tortispora caseinolytica NRRL Y-17796 TaxID=767744 RepID=A0A1E4TKS9_9ASCO|nr:hypothetical protein CANCADRAFT_928 [Tortispora caseinolytica NRRL Y-17796]
MAAYTLIHNPKCGTSRTVLAILKENGHEVNVIEYLKEPPTETTYRDWIARLGGSPRVIIRSKEPLYKSLNLDDENTTDDQLISALVANPILFNRPLVISPSGVVKVCRPADTVRDLL